MNSRMKARVDHAFEEMRRDQHRQASTRVDVAGTLDSAELDDHVWTRVSARTEDGRPDLLASIPDELRAFWVTRLFEHEVGFGGASGFLDWGGVDIAPFIPAAYQRLGLPAASAAFEQFWASPGMQALRRDPDTDQVDEAELALMIDAVGVHDADRIAFIRSNPDVFSI